MRKISKNDFLEMLQYSEPNHQICFCSVSSLQMLDYVENTTDISFEIAEIGEPLIGSLMIDNQIDEIKATELFYSSDTFLKLVDCRTQLFTKSWQEIYDILKKELLH